jgi:hypothetical protein
MSTSTTSRRSLRGIGAAVAIAIALLVPTGQAQAASRPAATAGCAHHTTGTCNLKARHPKGATAQCRDHTFSFSKHFSGTCSYHRGVLYWFK